jgi:hypothetical protein
MKLTAKRLLSVLMAIAMLFATGALMACNGDEGDGSGTGESTSAPATTGGNGDENPPEGETFDFGVIAFRSREMRIPSSNDVKIGGNMGPNTGWGNEGGGASCAIRIFGFQGFARPTDGFPDYGFGDYQDEDGVYQTLLSQNGPFWENIDKITASFFLDGDEDGAGEIGFIETFIQHGPLGSWEFRADTGINLIETVVDPEDDDDNFEWGMVMDAVWDFQDFRERHGTVTVWCEETESEVEKYILDIPVDEDGEGGGILKFGLMIENMDVIEMYLSAKIFFTDVKIYVYDLEEFFDYVAQVAEVTKLDYSDMTDRVIKVDRPS